MKDISRESIVKHMSDKKSFIEMYHSKGNVYSIPEFINLYDNTISQYEKRILNSMKKDFSKSIPVKLKTPVSRAKFLRNDKMKPIKCRRSGARSAFLGKNEYKLKGCNPKIGIYFPLVKYTFGSEKSESGRILFGVLSTDGVIREILAYCFFKHNKIRVLNKPICVYEYVHNNKILGYCIVTENNVGIRTERLLEYHKLSIKDLIKIKLLEKKFGINVLSGEIKVKGIDSKWYAKEKSNIMLEMNFNGGFRGVLNSNLGNDIVSNNKFFICDFDTFVAIDIPKNPDQTFIKSFVGWCFVEALKSAVPIWDYVNTLGKTSNETLNMLQNSLEKNSLFWKYYTKGFMERVKKLGWDLNHVNNSIKKIQSSDVYMEMISEIVINSEILTKSYEPKMGIYSLHD